MSKLFLLSEKEYEPNKKYILNEHSWWLRTPSADPYSDFVRSVPRGGGVDYYHSYLGDNGVRPAFKFQSDIYKDMSVGSIIHYGKLDWIKLNDGIYLSKDILFNHCFDENTNDYNKSEIKRKLRECESQWFTEDELSMIKDWIGGEKMTIEELKEKTMQTRIEYEKECNKRQYENIVNEIKNGTNYIDAIAYSLSCPSCPFRKECDELGGFEIDQSNCHYFVEKYVDNPTEKYSIDEFLNIYSRNFANGMKQMLKTDKSWDGFLFCEFCPVKNKCDTSECILKEYIILSEV